jgi:hypothetical protein
LTRLKQAEGRVKELSPEELAAFREWFAKFDAECALLDDAAGRSAKL